MKYRSFAKQAFERAKFELATEDPNRLKYAVLELRMALEGLVYQKATNYTEELCGKKLNTWQPAKLLEILLDIDPLADQTYTLRVKCENADSEKERGFTEIGTEKLINLKEIKSNYHKLGSFLHMPTIEQIEGNKGPTSEKIIKGCNKTLEVLEQVFSSTVYNSNLRVRATTDCIECGEKVVRRIPPIGEKIIANCINCSASYDIVPLENEQVKWFPKTTKLTCANPSCDKEVELWQNDVKVGLYWFCPSCKGKNHIVPGISFKPKEEIETQN